jgi:ATP-dependent Clp protease ATP-binding subunit ClpA
LSQVRSPPAVASLALTSSTAKDHAHVHVTPVHVATALLDEEGQGQSLLHSVLDKAGADPAVLSRSLNRMLVRLPSQDPPPPEADFSPGLHKVFTAAQSIMKDKNDTFISQDILILALLQDAQVAGAFKEAGATEANLKDAVNKIRSGKRVDSRTAEQGFEALKKYAQDLTALAEEGKLDPVIGRQDEIRRVIRVLSRRTKVSRPVSRSYGVVLTSRRRTPVSSENPASARLPLPRCVPQ